jgi:diaminopimelate epimerase
VITRKYHGLGNDYLVLEDAGGEALTPARVVRICDRHTGVGSDGILERVGADAGADFGLRIWNPDGTTAEKSGNGLRIFSRWLVDHQGAAIDHTISLPCGTVRCQVGPEEITVEMGQATFEPARVPCTEALLDTVIEVAGDTLRATAVGVGNPHCVIRCTEDLDDLPWRRWGAALEISDRFPNRTNCQFVRPISRTQVAARIWERGAGETQASGSSACAVAAAMVRLGLMDKEVEVVMPGGSLHVEVGEDWSITLTGPVAEVGRVEVAASVLG